MPRMIGYRLRLIELWSRERRIRRELRALRRQLHARNATAEEIHYATADLEIALLEFAEGRTYRHSALLVWQAQRLHVPVPPRPKRPPEDDDGTDEYWEALPVSNEWVLKPKGIREVRNEIREEKKARRDYILGWISPFVGIIAAIVGAVVGFLLGRRA
jgi:hypothetical protein